MNIVFIDPEEFLVDQLRDIAIEEDDNLFILSDKLNKINGFICIKESIVHNYEEAKKKVLEVCNPDIIFTFNENSLEKTAILCNELNLPFHPLEVIKKNRDKKLMKESWRQYALSTASEYFCLSTKEVLDNAGLIKYPVILKPSMGMCSLGVMKANSEEELKIQLNKIALLNLNFKSKDNAEAGVLIENYIEGDEYAVDTVWFNSKPVISGILSRNNSDGPYFPDSLYYCDPYLDNDLSREILKASYSAVHATGVRYGSTHTEMRIKGGKIYLIETAARPGAGGFFYEYVLKNAYGIDFLRAAYYSYTFNNKIQSFMSREKKEIDFHNNCIFFYNYHYDGSGIINNIEGIEKVKSRSEVQTLYQLKKTGDLLYNENMNAGYLIWIVACKDNYREYAEIDNLTKLYQEEIKISFKS